MLNVSKAGALTSELCRALHTHVVFLQKRPSGRRAEPAGAYQQRAPGPGRLKTKAVKKPAKKNTTEPANLNLDDDGDDDESEVELDSLGSFFIHLIDNDCY